MMNTELYEILKILSPEEFKALRTAVCSPQFFGNTTVERLYTALRPKYPDFNLSPTDVRKVFKKVFPKKPFSQKILERVSDNLIKVTEAFLLKLQLDKDEDFRLKMTVRMTEERSHLFFLFQKAQKELHELSDKMKDKNVNYWHTKAELYDSLYGNLQHDKYDFNDRTLDELSDATDCFFTLFIKNRTEDLRELSDDETQNYFSLFLKEITMMHAK